MKKKRKRDRDGAWLWRPAEHRYVPKEDRRIKDEIEIDFNVSGHRVGRISVGSDWIEVIQRKQRTGREFTPKKFFDFFEKME